MDYEVLYLKRLLCLPACAPEWHAPPSAPLRCSRSPNKLIHEAERAVQADERRAWSAA